MEQPLHVKVAAALGWTKFEYIPPRNSMNLNDNGTWRGCPPPLILGNMDDVPLYDKDWRATGPLIKQYGINISCNGKYWFADALLKDDYTCLHIGENSGFLPCGDRSEHPLISVCLAILAIKKEENA